MSNTMKYTEFLKLSPGDIVRGKLSERTFVVTANYGGRVTAVDSVDITNPNEWDLLVFQGIHCLDNGAQQQESKERAKQIVQQSKAGSEDSTQISAIADSLDDMNQVSIYDRNKINQHIAALRKLLPC